MRNIAFVGGIQVDKYKHTNTGDSYTTPRFSAVEKREHRSTERQEEKRAPTVGPDKTETERAHRLYILRISQREGIHCLCDLRVGHSRLAIVLGHLLLQLLGVHAVGIVDGCTKSRWQYNGNKSHKRRESE